MIDSIQIETGSRVHFGLLRTEAPFGGLGMMVQSPTTRVSVSPSRDFEIEQAFTKRLQAIGKRMADHFALGASQLDKKGLPKARLRVLQSAPAHHGLGSGTQLSLAAADALTRFYDLECDQSTLAYQIAGRGRRSAIGAHGYFTGGMIYEACAQDNQTGRAENQTLNQVRWQIDVPTPWRIVLVRPHQQAPVIHGKQETQHFQNITQQQAAQELQNIAEKRILPALQTKDFASFAEAIEAFNHTRGMMYQSVQGGPYNGEAVTALVQDVKAIVGSGVGQSSWGPTVFAWCENETQAKRLAEQLTRQGRQPQITAALNQGRVIA